jgi:hypothetical protein
MLSLAAAVTLLSPAIASDDLDISKLQFGAAITMKFDDVCRPVKDIAMRVALAVMLGANKEESDEAFRNANKLMYELKSKVFCEMFEHNVQIMEGAR